jgi:hypothetical protein
LRRDADAGNLTFDALLGLIKSRGGNVQRFIEDGPLVRDRSREEQPCLVSRSCAQFNQTQALALRSQSDHFAGMSGENGPLGAGEVVLGKLGDLLKEA